MDFTGVRKPVCRTDAASALEDRGAVTIEFAIALIGLVAILAAILLGFAGAITGIRSIDAAHTAARMSARGESWEAIEASVSQTVSSQARIETQPQTPDGKLISITVTAPVPNTPWLWEVSHTAVAYVEKRE